MKQFVNDQYDYESTGESKIKENEDEEEIPTMVIDKDQDVKTKGKIEDANNH